MNFDNTGDYVDSFNYGTERDGYAADGYTVPAESAPAPRPAPPVVTGNPQVSPLRRGLEALRLGEFTAEQLCYMRPLSRLAWAYLSLMSDGSSYDALGVLSVYRALFNSQRAAIVGGLSPSAQSALPSSLSEIAWTDPMRLSMQIVLSASISAGRADRNEALLRMPTSALEIAAWFRASRGLFDETSLRTYLEVPRAAGSELAPSILAAVRDDIETCLHPAAPPRTYTIGPATGVAPGSCPPGSVLVNGRCQSVTATSVSPTQGSRQNNGGAPASGQSKGLFWAVIAALAAGAWWVYREETKASLREAETNEA